MVGTDAAAPRGVAIPRHYVLMPGSVPFVDDAGILHTDDSCSTAAGSLHRRAWHQVAGFPLCSTCEVRDRHHTLPRRRLIGPCRLCGEERVLTEEHVPPYKAFNWDMARGILEPNG